MWVWWSSIGTMFYTFLVALVLVSGIRECLSLNDEGLALLQFRAGVDYDPHHALSSWNPGDADPCSWERVYCKDGRVEILDLSRLSLRGTLAPDLGRLSHLRSLWVFDDEFEGHVPLEINEVNLLSELQFHETVINRKLGDGIFGNSLRKLSEEDSFVIPIRGVLTRFLNALPLPLFKFGNLSRHGCTDSFSGLLEPHNVQNAQAVSFDHRRLLQQPGDVPAQPAPLLEPSSTNIPVQPTPLPVQPVPLPVQPAPLPESSNTNIPVQPAPLPVQPAPLPVQPAPLPKPSSTNIPVQPAPLSEPSGTNIPALPPPPTPAKLSPDPIITLPTSKSSGSLPAISDAKKTPTSMTSSPAETSNTSTPVPVEQSNHQLDDTSRASVWERYGKYIIAFLALNLLFVISAMLIIMFRRRGMTAIRPWKTGLSGQLQKAFITGVPKLNRSELDVACEDFSNIIETLDTCTVYKGTLSSGVEIAVASATIESYKDWSNSAEKAFWKKIDTLSRVNHKNFVNLIGYCEENEPFTRMMVFEYAPNGTFFEHLHDEGVEHLDWSARMRIVMGTAYYLQYIHHDLNPPVAHSDLHSKNIILTDDYAAKIVDIIFSPKCKPKSKISGEEESSEPHPMADTKANVYRFGILLLETITGKLPYSEEHGSLLNWASQYLNDKNNIEKMIDPTLKTFKNNELDMICDIIQDCIKLDPKQRPTMREIVSKLRGVLSISPEQAVPRLSPLWWAELEILSAEAA